MGIKKSDAKFTEPFVGTTEVIVMMSVQGGRSTSSAVRLDYNAVHTLEKAIVDYTFLDDTPQNERRTDRDGDVWEWRGDAWYCIGQADTPQTEEYDFRDEQEYNDRWQTDCGWK